LSVLRATGQISEHIAFSSLYNELGLDGDDTREQKANDLIHHNIVQNVDVCFDLRCLSLNFLYASRRISTLNFVLFYQYQMVN
jgi:hypothetical protein